MKKKQKCPECPKCLPGWLVQFGDLMSLLLCFFILLLSMATMDKKKVEEYFDIMRKSIGFLDGAETISATDIEPRSKKNTQNYTNEIQIEEGSLDNLELKEELNDAINEFNQKENEEEINLQTNSENNEFILDIPSEIFFDNNQYELVNKKDIKLIRKISRIIRTMTNDYQIEIIGYSNNNINHQNPPRNSWDIAALRSITIIKEFLKNKINSDNLKASSYGNAYNKDEKTEIRLIKKTFKENNFNEINILNNNL